MSSPAPVHDDDLGLAAAVLALDPAAFGGAVLVGGPGPVREAWLAALRAALPAGTPWRRLPAAVDDARLLGGRDLGASLQVGRPVWQAGLLAETDGGVLQIPGAERLGPALAARLARALDRAAVDGPEGAPVPARLACIACDERSPAERETPEASDDGAGALPGVPLVLADRLAFSLSLDVAAAGATDLDPAARSARWRAALGSAAALPPWPLPVDAAMLAAARGRWRQVAVAPAVLEALCAAAQALGLDDLRLPWWALQAARAAAALRGLDAVDEASLRWASRVVLAPRARRLPAPAEAPDAATDTAPPDAAPEAAPEVDEGADPPPPSPPPPTSAEAAPPPEPPPSSESAADPPPGPEATPDATTVLDAVRSALPPGLLARLAAAALAPPAARRAGAGGQAAAGRRAGAGRGRLQAARPGRPQGGAALALVETLQAALPWQAWRRAAPTAAVGGSAGLGRGRDVPASASAAALRLRVQPDDLRVRRREPRRVATTIFLVDASGSAAMHRLAEAKGAVEQLLAECYVRRDQVAVLAFRGAGAETLLPPTRSLVRARRALSGLPGGGGTPLAAGLAQAQALAARLLRDGGLPLLVMLTDGRANLSRDGRPGREAAMADAARAAVAWRSLGVAALVLDTAPSRGAPGTATPASEAVARLARAMGAACLPLPPSPQAWSGVLHTVQALQGAAPRAR